MLVSVYLNNEVHDILTMFGSLEEVVNRILDEGEKGSFNIMDKPNYGSREGANRYNINITNATYIEMVQRFPINSSRISLRRLLQWFVYEEIYNNLGWKIVKKYTSKLDERVRKQKNIVETRLLLMKKYCNNKQQVIVDEMLKLLKEL